MRAVTANPTAESLIYKRVGPSFLGRFFLFGFGCLLGTADVLAVIYGNRHASWGWALFAFLGLLFAAWMAIQAALYRGYIAVDHSRNELVLVERGFYPGVWRTKVPIDLIESVHFRLSRGGPTGGGGWQLHLKYKNGKTKLFSLLSGNESAEEIAQAIAEKIGVTFSRI
jgi:hypothetical protein